MSNSLQAPWRIDYIRSLSGTPKGDGCFLCDAAAADPARWHDHLVLWRTQHTVVLLNRFPYTNGHLLVAPLSHAAEFEELPTDVMTDLSLQTAQAIRVLKKAVSAQGFNVGLNLGRVAGAGVPGHLHQHVVPRWGGDVNFMTVIGEVQVIPQALSQVYAELLRLREAGR
jgi:ATP adenylyltransferase